MKHKDMYVKMLSFKIKVFSTIETCQCGRESRHSIREEIISLHRLLQRQGRKEKLKLI